jgi:hypothetical protein
VNATKATQKDDADAVKTFQLGTARLPANVDEETVKDALYQWASTLTTDANLPFALPQRVDRTPEGFDMAFLMSDGAAPGEFAPVGAISASVEDAPDGDARVLMIRGLRERYGSRGYAGGDEFYAGGDSTGGDHGVAIGGVCLFVCFSVCSSKVKCLRIDDSCVRSFVCLFVSCENLDVTFAFTAAHTSQSLR